MKLPEVKLTTSAPLPSFFHPGIHPKGLLCSETVNTQTVKKILFCYGAKPLVNKYYVVFSKSKKKAQHRHIISEWSTAP